MHRNATEQVAHHAGIASAALNLLPGDHIDIHIDADRSFGIEKTPGALELLARLRKYRGRLPADFRFDRLEANARD
jgi:antitoxin MazE